MASGLAESPGPKSVDYVGSKFKGVRWGQAWIGAHVEGTHQIFTEVDMASVSGRQESGVGNVVSGELHGVDLKFIKYNL